MWMVTVHGPPGVTSWGQSGGLPGVAAFTACVVPETPCAGWGAGLVDPGEGICGRCCVGREVAAGRKEPKQREDEPGVGAGAGEGKEPSWGHQPGKRRAKTYSSDFPFPPVKVLAHQAVTLWGAKSVCCGFELHTKDVEMEREVEGKGSLQGFQSRLKARSLSGLAQLPACSPFASVPHKVP